MEIKKSAPLGSRRQWSPAGVVVFDRLSATETAREGNERRDASLVFRASLTPGEDGVQVLAGGHPAAWPGAIAPRENRAYSHDLAVLAKIASGEPKGKGKEWAGKNRL